MQVPATVIDAGRLERCSLCKGCAEISIVGILEVGQYHGVQFSQLHHSTVNVKINKCLHTFLRQFERYKTFKMLTFKK